MTVENKKPAFSIIVPVLNEENGIRSFLQHLKDISAGESVEFVVVDADPAGSTINKIRAGEAIKLLSPKGRGIQMNMGAEVAKGNVLLFLHADTFLPENALGYIKNVLTDDTCVGGAFDLGIDSERILLRLTAYCASLKHRMTRVPYGDQAIFIRSDFFRDIGGYSEVPLFEDVEIMRRIKKLKKKITIIRYRTRTSPRKWEKEGVLYTILHNWTLQAFYLLGTSPECLVKYYYGEKVTNNALILFLKYPECKMVKTRIAAALGDDFAFGLYTAFIRDLLVMAGFVGADKIIAIDGPAGVPIDSLDFGTGYSVIRQNGNDIGDRMLNAFEYVFNSGYKKAVLIGSDLPGLPAALIDNAFAALDTADAAIGKSTDGGYYLIGFRKETCSPDYFKGIIWSSSSVFQRTIEKFNRSEKSVYRLPEWNDIDDHNDLKKFYEKNSNRSGPALYTMKYLTEMFP